MKEISKECNEMKKREISDRLLHVEIESSCGRTVTTRGDANGDLVYSDIQGHYTIMACPDGHDY